MPAQKPVKKRRIRLIGVVMSPADLGMAARISSPPDFFELRLDSLLTVKGLEQKARALPAPLVITARHPSEGGKNNLSAAARGKLLLQFLPLARYVDVELRSAGSQRTVIERAKRSGIDTIISFHDLSTTPQVGSLRAKARQAANLGAAIFKVATRTDSPAELARLIEFVSAPPPRLRLSVMGIGTLGAISRILLSQCHSQFVYTSLGRPQTEGQITLNQFRSIFRHLRAG